MGHKIASDKLRDSRDTQTRHGRKQMYTGQPVSIALQGWCFGVGNIVWVSMHDYTWSMFREASVEYCGLLEWIETHKRGK